MYLEGNTINKNIATPNDEKFNFFKFEYTNQNLPKGEHKQ